MTLNPAPAALAGDLQPQALHPVTSPGAGPFFVLSDLIIFGVPVEPAEVQVQALATAVAGGDQHAGGDSVLPSFNNHWLPQVLRLARSVLTPAALLGALATAFSANATTVAVGQQLDIAFHLDAPSRPNSTILDTVLLAFGEVGKTSATQAVATLYDGTQVLGSYTTSSYVFQPFPFYFFFSAVPTFTGPSPAHATLIDGTALADRSLAGKLTVQFNDAFEFSDLYLTVGQAWNGSAVVSESGQGAVLDGWTVTAASAVPEPGGWLLMATCLAALGLVRRRAS